MNFAIYNMATQETTSTTTPCHLLRVPRELGLEIYRHLGKTVKITDHALAVEEGDDAISVLLQRCMNPTLLQINRIINAEYSEVAYQYTAAHIVLANNLSLRSLVQLLRPGAHLSVLRFVKHCRAADGHTVTVDQRAERQAARIPCPSRKK